MKPGVLSSTASPQSSRLTIAISFSSGIRDIKHIASFLGVDKVCSPDYAFCENTAAVAVLVWGRKQNGRRALRFAKAKSLPVWYLEDGFVRSCDSDPHSRRTYSVIIDKIGVYYDSTEPCDMESLLNLADDKFDDLCSEQILSEAAACRRLLVQENITKYNYCKTPVDSHLFGSSMQTLVLVIDQTLNDASVNYGGMSQQSFKRMLDAALAENPKSRVVVRTHPDVVAGLRDGYLLDYARECSVPVSADADNPIVWLKQAARVYVGTSQLGYEALLCGCDVTIFGQPFYAGWGLTDDRNPIEKRVRQRSLDQLFFVSHMAMTNYCNPVNGERWTLRQCLDHVIEQKRQFARNAHAFFCVGITPWKRRYLRRYLRSPDGCVSFGKPQQQMSSTDKSLTWGFRQWVTESTVNPVRVEDGFLRSSGLGSDFVAPSSLVIDMQGMYFDRHRSSDLENLLNTEVCSDEQQARASQLRDMIVSAGLSKYNMPGRDKVSRKTAAAKHAGKTVILIIGQVEDDESIRRGCAQINTNTALCKAVRKKHPGDYLLYKPHPDVESGNRKGAVEARVLTQCIDEVACNISITQVLESSDVCHTMTSLTGFEALLRGKPVVTYGLPFYAGWGLTQDEITCERRTRTRTLDELVYMTLIAYPRYLHVESGEFITAEAQVLYLKEQQLESRVMNTMPRWKTKVENIVKSLRYAA